MTSLGTPRRVLSPERNASKRNYFAFNIIVFFDRHESNNHGHLSARAVPDNEFVNGSRSQHLIIEASIYFLPGFSSLLAFKIRRG